MKRILVLIAAVFVAFPVMAANTLPDITVTSATWVAVSSVPNRSQILTGSVKVVFAADCGAIAAGTTGIHMSNSQFIGQTGSGKTCMKAVRKTAVVSVTELD